MPGHVCAGGGCPGSGPRLCRACAGARADELEALLARTGRWMRAHEVAEAVAADEFPCVERRVRAAPEGRHRIAFSDRGVAHEHVVAIGRAGDTPGGRDCTRWPPALLGFAANHAAKNGLYINRDRTVIRPRTRHNVTDAASMVAALRAAGAAGIPLADMVAEYTGAYMDLHAMLTETPSCVTIAESQIWHSPQPARSRRSRPTP